MKIAFCFLTYGDLSKPDIWNAYFHGYVYGKDFDIFLHPKEPNKVVTEYRKNIINNLIDTEWGDISLVRATISMLREAYKDKNNKSFILISDTTIPVVSFKVLQESLLLNNKNFLKLTTVKYQDTKRLNACCEDYHKIFSGKPVKHHQWFIFTRETVSFLIDKKNDYTSCFETMFAPDEHYFGLVLNLHKIPSVDRWSTFADWNRSTDKRLDTIRQKPTTFFELSKDYVSYIRYTFNPFFIRKIIAETKIYSELKEEISS